jgi:GWxTD domain-containing protein
MRGGGREVRPLLRVCGALAATGAAALAAAAAGAADEQARDALPLLSTGDLAFHVDFAGYRGEGGLTDEEIYVSVTNDQLGFSEGEGTLEGELRLGVVMRDPDGKSVAERETKLVPQAATESDARDRGILQVIREQVDLPPGRYHVTIELTDEKTVRAGLFNRMRGAKQRGTAEGWIEVQDFAGAGLHLSDLALVRSSRPAADGSFGRHGVDFDPNPSRLYGLALPVTRCYVEVYGGEPFEPGTSFLVRTRMLDRSGIVVQEKKRRATPNASAFIVTDELPLPPREIVAGRYALDVEVYREGSGEAASVRRDFDVIWSVASWGQDPDALFQEMAFLMKDSEYRKLEELSPGAREIYLAEFWRGLDPDPGSAENEALATFRQRVAIADREFESTLQRGLLTDRGRVYVRYGPPDEVNFEYNSSGFGLDGTHERVAGPGERASLGNRPSTSFLGADEFREGDVSEVAEQTGGVNIEAKALEVWVYNGHGHPLTPQQLEPSSHRGLKFIFADEMGDGNYVLVSSVGASLY